MIKWFSKQYTELMAAGPGEYVLRTPYDFIPVKGIDVATINQLLDTFETASTYDDIEKVFPAAGRPEVRELILRLRRSISAARHATRMVDSPSVKQKEVRPRPIVVIGNGRVAQAISERLKSQKLQSTFVQVTLADALMGEKFNERAQSSIVVPFAAPPAPTPKLMPDRVVEKATSDQLVELIGGFELVICAFEDVRHRAFMAVADAAERAARPALFVTAGLGMCIVGPVTVPGVNASFIDAYRALCRQASDDFADDRFIELVRSPTADETQATVVAEYVGNEVSELFGPWPESVLFGHLVEVTREASVSRLAPVLRTAEANEPAAQKVRAMWPELYDAAVVRLAVTDAACTSHRSDRQIPSANSTIKRICVVGGGTAGYLTALTLRKRLPHLEVSLLESSKVPIIGVGEATTPSLPALLHGVLGIDIVDFFREVQPTFKLGIKFEWGGNTPGYYFNYPFGAHGQVLEAQHYQGHILDYSLQSMLMSANKVPIFRTGEGTYESRLHFGTISYAYHIDNQRFVRCLQKEAKRAGIKHIDATVKDVVKDSTGEMVAALITDDGQRHEYDFYVDCSGFRSLLLEQSLGSEWISYASTLFTDHAIAGNVPHGGKIKPYTTAETMDHGWCWNISTPQEDHRGYVFSSRFCDADQAVAEMKRKNPGLGETRVVKFRSGRHREFWKGNVVAIGNAYAFVEPLESTGIHMIIESILAFIGSFPQSVHDEQNRRYLNRHIGNYWDELRWFLGIHFRFNTKLDTPFWKTCRSEVNISGLEPVLHTFQEAAPLSYRNHHLEFDRLWGDHGRDVMLMGQRVPANLLPPRESKEQWMQRVQLARRAVDLAIPQAEALALLNANPHVLEHLVTDDRTWMKAVSGVFKRETAPFFEVQHARQGRMDKPRDSSLDQNVLLPKGAF